MLLRNEASTQRLPLTCNFAACDDNLHHEENPRSLDDAQADATTPPSPILSAKHPLFPRHGLLLRSSSDVPIALPVPSVVLGSPSDHAVATPNVLTRSKETVFPGAAPSAGL